MWLRKPEILTIWPFTGKRADPWLRIGSPRCRAFFYAVCSLHPSWADMHRPVQGRLTACTAGDPPQCFDPTWTGLCPVQEMSPLIKWQCHIAINGSKCVLFSFWCLARSRPVTHSSWSGSWPTLWVALAWKPPLYSTCPVNPCREWWEMVQMGSSR